MRAAIHQPEASDVTPAQRLERLRTVLRDRAPKPLDLVVCPELFLSGYNVGGRVAQLAEAPDGPFAMAAADMARENETALIYGYPERGPDGRVYNSAICIGKDGRLLANHRKLRLPPNFEREWFVGGDRYTFLDLAGFKLAILVCYDVEFPEAVRACAMAGAQVVVVPTALKAQWTIVARAMVPTRALENGVYVLYANHCGRENGFTYLGASGVIGPDGADIVRAGADEELLVAEIAHEPIAAARAVLPYLVDRAGLDSL